MFGVDEDERQQRGNENKIKRQRGAQAIVPRDADKQRRGEKLDRRITKRNVFFATAALSAQRDITKHRNVVVKSDHRAARRTARVWKDDRLFERNAMNYNVEKTADDRAEDSGDDVTKRWGNQVQINHAQSV